MLAVHMWKLNSYKGFTMIETVCSLAVFSILFYSTVYLEANTIRLKRHNKEMENNTELLNIIETNLRCNTGYDEINNLFKQKDTLYINKQNLNIESLKNNFTIDNLLTGEFPKEVPYIRMNIEKGEVLKIVLQLKYNDNSQVLEDQFYKGDYR